MIQIDLWGIVADGVREELLCEDGRQRLPDPGDSSLSLSLSCFPPLPVSCTRYWGAYSLDLVGPGCLAEQLHRVDKHIIPPFTQ